MAAIAKPLNQAPAPVCLWRENPNGLVSWWDMEEFSGLDLVRATSSLDAIYNAWESAQPHGDAAAARLLGQTRKVTNSEREQLALALGDICTKLSNSGLYTSAEAATEAHAAIKPSEPDFGWQLTPADILQHIGHIRGVIRLEMKTVLFLHIQPDDARRYRTPLRDWENVIARWQELSEDIAECSRCFALGRYSAAIFHSLLVAEFGTVQLGKLMGVAGDRPGWGCADRLQAILDKDYKNRNPLEQQHSTLLKNTIDSVMALKNARHITMHVDNKGDWLARNVGPQTANEVISTTRGLMRRLAEELPR